MHTETDYKETIMNRARNLLIMSLMLNIVSLVSSIFRSSWCVEWMSYILLAIEAVAVIGIALCTIELYKST